MYLEGHSENCQTSNMKLFPYIFNGFQWLTIFAKISILREGYTANFFFQSISKNTNLSLISQCILTLNLN